MLVKVYADRKRAKGRDKEREEREGREAGDLTNTCQNCNACHVVVMTITEPNCRNCSIIALGNTLPRENSIERGGERQAGRGNCSSIIWYATQSVALSVSLMCKP